MEVFNTDDALIRVEGDSDFLNELTGMFFSSYGEKLASLKSASEPQSVLALAHSLKGSLYNLGAERAGSIAMMIELQGRNGSAASELQSLVSSLEESIAEFKAASEKFFSNR